MISGRDMFSSLYLGITSTKETFGVKSTVEFVSELCIYQRHNIFDTIVTRFKIQLELCYERHFGPLK